MGQDIVVFIQLQSRRAFFKRSEQALINKVLHLSEATLERINGADILLMHFELYFIAFMERATTRSVAIARTVILHLV